MKNTSFQVDALLYFMKIMDFMDLILIYGEKLLQLLSICFWFWHDLHDSFRNKDSILANLVVARESGTRLVACKLKKLTPFNQKKSRCYLCILRKLKICLRCFISPYISRKEKLKLFLRCFLSHHTFLKRIKTSEVFVFQLCSSKFQNLWKNVLAFYFFIKNSKSSPNI